MEKILLTYIGQRLIGRRLVHFYQEGDLLPIGFDERIAGWESIGCRVEVERNKLEIIFTGIVLEVVDPGMRFEWQKLERISLQKWQKLPKTFLQVVANYFRLKSKFSFKAKLLGKFLILPYGTTPSFILNCWLAQNPEVSSNFVLHDEGEIDDWFFTIVLTGSTEEGRENLVNKINNEI